ncbi:MAG TPA: hypothetical protein VJB89_00100 [Candidatus Nanoarchaeia archaeon]|nr:hypothetical protein [Candidatus Nanoarchaeia archaeon]
MWRRKNSKDKLEKQIVEGGIIGILGFVSYMGINLAVELEPSLIEQNLITNIARGAPFLLTIGYGIYKYRCIRSLKNRIRREEHRASKYIRHY